MTILDQLKSQVKNIYINEPMCKHTSLKIGGNADFFVEAQSVDDIINTINIANKNSLPLFIFGKGSNILVSDSGIRGIVLHISKLFANLSLQNNIIVASSGVSLSELANYAMANGYTGLEFASGIPGSVGGAVIMNAGAYGGEMKDCVDYVRFVDNNANIHSFSNSQMNFTYRHSALQEYGYTVIEVGFKLDKGNKSQIQAQMQELNSRRALKQPLEYPSCGSVFKRPEGSYASMLIEQCGLKGMRNGGCAVSAKHAGFIVNDKGATAKEYLDLIHMVQDKVFTDTGFCLDTEVRLIGEF